MSMTGQCLCGAVTFRAENTKTDHHACHCDMCRKWNGGPVLAASVGALEFEGDENICTYNSSEWAERGFCKKCGTHLFYRLKQTGDTVVWVGSFDDQAPFKLAGDIYIDSKPPGYDFSGDHPRMTEQQFLVSIGQAPA